MKKQYILLNLWAEKNGLTANQAKQMAIRGRLKGIAVLKPVKVLRYVIDEKFTLPKK